MTGETRPAPLVLPVLQAHLDDAASACSRLNYAFGSARYTLEEVRARPERLWFSHIDGLCIAGPRYFESTLRSHLALVNPDEPGHFASVAMVAFRLGQWDTILPALFEGDLATREAAVRAMALADVSKLDTWITSTFGVPAVRSKRIALMRAAAARGVALDQLLLPLQSDDEDEVVAALEAVRWADPNKHVRAVEWLLSTSSSRVQRSAVPVGLGWGSKLAWENCQRLADDAATCDAGVLRLLALLGGPVVLPALERAMTWDTHREAAVRALGFLGDVRVVERLLTLIGGDNGRISKLAGEAVATITGLHIDDEHLLASGDDADSEDSDSDVERDPYAHELPRLDGKAVSAWWSKNGAKFDGTQRVLLGNRDTYGQRSKLLRQGSMRLRAVLAEEVGVRSSWMFRIDPCATTAVQERQLDRLPALGPRELPVRFSMW